MIEKAEIDSKADALGVHTSNVQRDYVFGWLLAGLYQPSNPMARVLSLKGGNAFRKAYFEHARFSNDLDFSTETELSETAFSDGLSEACEFATKRSGVDFGVREARLISRMMDGEEGKLYKARVYFRSFYGEEDFDIRVDLDVKEFDRIFLPIQSRSLVHAYSDASTCQASIQVHKLEELLASKLVALLRRQHSPDLFDFVFTVFVQRLLDVSRREIVTTFLKKSIYERTPQIARGLLLDLPFAVFRGLWDEFLVLPRVSALAFDEAERGFREVISDLFAQVAPAPQFATVGVGPVPQTYFGSSIRSTLLEGGRLHRVLRVVYDGFERLVEPYALVFKRRQDGVAHEYLYVWDRSGGRSGKVGIKSFFPDKVRSAEITTEEFQPQFPIEMAKTGVSYFSSPTFSSRPPAARRTRQQYGGATHTIECPYCGKRFQRKSYDTKLNDHKDRFGNKCYGRVGFMV